MSHVFAERLRQARNDLGLTQYDLALRVGVRQDDISRYERGAQLPKLDSLVAVAQELNRSMDWLCGLEN